MPVCKISSGFCLNGKVCVLFHGGCVLFLQKTLLEWRYFFLIALVMNVLMDLLIILFWKSDVQEFAKSSAETPGTETPAEDACRV